MLVENFTFKIIDGDIFEVITADVVLVDHQKIIIDPRAGVPNSVRTDEDGCLLWMDSNGDGLYEYAMVMSKTTKNKEIPEVIGILLNEDMDTRCDYERYNDKYFPVSWLNSQTGFDYITGIAHDAAWNDFLNGMAQDEMFLIRTTIDTVFQVGSIILSTLASTAIGASIGGPWGALGGAIVGLVVSLVLNLAWSTVSPTIYDLLEEVFNLNPDQGVNIIDDGKESGEDVLPDGRTYYWNKVVAYGHANSTKYPSFAEAVVSHKGAIEVETTGISLKLPDVSHVESDDTELLQFLIGWLPMGSCATLGTKEFSDEYKRSVFSHFVDEVVPERESLASEETDGALKRLVPGIDSVGRVYYCLAEQEGLTAFNMSDSATKAAAIAIYQYASLYQAKYAYDMEHDAGIQAVQATIQLAQTVAVVIGAKAAMASFNLRVKKMDLGGDKFEWITRKPGFFSSWGGAIKEIFGEVSEEMIKEQFWSHFSGALLNHVWSNDIVLSIGGTGIEFVINADTIADAIGEAVGGGVISSAIIALVRSDVTTNMMDTVNEISRSMPQDPDAQVEFLNNLDPAAAMEAACFLSKCTNQRSIDLSNTIMSAIQHNEVLKSKHAKWLKAQSLQLKYKTFKKAGQYAMSVVKNHPQEVKNLIFEFMLTLDYGDSFFDCLYHPKTEAMSTAANWLLQYMGMDQLIDNNGDPTVTIDFTLALPGQTQSQMFNFYSETKVTMADIILSKGDIVVTDSGPTVSERNRMRAEIDELITGRHIGSQVGVMNDYLDNLCERVLDSESLDIVYERKKCILLIERIINNIQDDSDLQKSQTLVGLFGRFGEAIYLLSQVPSLLNNYRSDQTVQDYLQEGYHLSLRPNFQPSPNRRFNIDLLLCLEQRDADGKILDRKEAVFISSKVHRTLKTKADLVTEFVFDICSSLGLFDDVEGILDPSSIREFIFPTTTEDSQPDWWLTLTKKPSADSVPNDWTGPAVDTIDRGMLYRVGSYNVIISIDPSVPTSIVVKIYDGTTLTQDPFSVPFRVSGHQFTYSSIRGRFNQFISNELRNRGINDFELGEFDVDMDEWVDWELGSDELFDELDGIDEAVEELDRLLGILDEILDEQLQSRLDEINELLNEIDETLTEIDELYAEIEPVSIQIERIIGRSISELNFQSLSSHIPEAEFTQLPHIAGETSLTDQEIESLVKSHYLSPISRGTTESYRSQIKFHIGSYKRIFVDSEGNWYVFRGRDLTRRIVFHSLWK